MSTQREGRLPDRLGPEPAGGRKKLLEYFHIAVFIRQVRTLVRHAFAVIAVIAAFPAIGATVYVGLYPEAIWDHFLSFSILTASVLLVWTACLFGAIKASPLIAAFVNGDAAAAWGGLLLGRAISGHFEFELLGLVFAALILLAFCAGAVRMCALAGQYAEARKTVPPDGRFFLAVRNLLWEIHNTKPRKDPGIVEFESATFIDRYKWRGRLFEDCALFVRRQLRDVHLAGRGEVRLEDRKAKRRKKKRRVTLTIGEEELQAVMRQRSIERLDRWIETYPDAPPVAES